MLGTAAHSENHASMLWIGDCAGAGANLIGIEQDACNARRIALAIDAPESRIAESQNRQFALASLSSAMRALARRCGTARKI